MLGDQNDYALAISPTFTRDSITGSLEGITLILIGSLFVHSVLLFSLFNGNEQLRENQCLMWSLILNGHQHSETLEVQNTSQYKCNSSVQILEPCKKDK